MSVCNQPHLSCFLLKFLNGSLVDSSAFVDQMAGGGGFAGVDMTNNHDVDVDFLFTHTGGLLWRNTGILVEQCVALPNVMTPSDQPFNIKYNSLVSGKRNDFIWSNSNTHVNQAKPN